MQIKGIKWANHPVLGDLVLDLTDPVSSMPYETVVFAGENGIGKSTVLEEISSFLNLGPFPQCEYLEYVIDNATYRAVPTPNNTMVGFFDVIDVTGKRVNVRSNANNNRLQIDKTTYDPRRFGCVVSRARADFKTQPITTSKTSSLDVEKHESDAVDDFTSLKQLIVDLSQQDNSEYANRNKSLGLNPISWEVFYPDSKIYRFKKAFDTFFETIQFDGVVDQPDQKEVRFKKNGTSISLDKLSTGEKQIVFRGIHLLKNSKKLEGGLGVIDEPELSMHPRWQQRILDYYKSLFTQDLLQYAQLFFATHSDHVLKQALQKDSRVGVVVLEQTSSGIAARKVNSFVALPQVTSAQVNYSAFNLASVDYHIQLYGWLQEKNAFTTVKACDEFIKAQTAFNSNVHQKCSGHGQTRYETLPTYVRNAIHHPSVSNTFSENDLRTSIELLVELCR